MTIEFTASGNDVLFAGAHHTTEKSAESAVEKAAELNAAFKRVLAETNGDTPDPSGPGTPSDEGQFVPFGNTTDPDYRKPASSQQHQPEEADMDPEETEIAGKGKKLPPATKSNPDPDHDGDDDTNAKGDTDHDYWTAGGKKKESARDFTAGERKTDAKSGVALPDGSFPIANVADLKNAIQAIGRAKNPMAAKAHIKSRAKALGSTNLIPDSWK